jgi:putative SOS response-associated peptidase YedK
VCTNYEPFLDDEEFAAAFGASLPTVEFKRETFPGYAAPVVRTILRKDADSAAGRECVAARFGLVPYWAKPEDAMRPTPRYATFNARVETVGELASFKHAWHKAQFCLIPVTSYYEPCWETGKAVRWKMSLLNSPSFALAGIWENWSRDDVTVESFSMLTVNADDHPIMKRMHRPGDEKRMPVIVAEEEYEPWLTATPEQARAMCQTYPAELMRAEASPLTRKPRTKPG